VVDLGQDLAGARRGRSQGHATPPSPVHRSPRPQTFPPFLEPPSPLSPALHTPQQARGARPTPLQALLTPLQACAVLLTAPVMRWSMQGRGQDWGLAHLPRVSSDGPHLMEKESPTQTESSKRVCCGFNTTSYSLAGKRDLSSSLQTTYRYSRRQAPGYLKWAHFNTR